MQDGIFKAKAQGFHGVLTVTTTIKDNKLKLPTPKITMKP
jgi:uncharacterized protein with FMN-binding domain